MPDFEAFVEDVVNRVQANPKVWAETAILVTTDEGGGYYDSGYVQPVDFFGDGTRIPLIAISPYAKPGFVDHTYGDHASILKFIERNWGLKPLSVRSRDNLPNPVMSENAYVPANAPAVGDLMALFDFNLPHTEEHGMKH
jgi:phospholipase C